MLNFSRRSRVRLIACTLMAVVACTTFALAGKPGGGSSGGGGGTIEGGTIYFQVPSLLATMDSSGNNKTPLAENVGVYPSRRLYGGRRWFVQKRYIDGNTYHDGTSRHQEAYAKATA